MPICKSKKANLLFVRGTTTWGELTADQQADWKHRARLLVYPDLRLGYDFHREMLYTLAVALYESYQYYLQGGGEQQERCEYVASIFDLIRDKEKRDKEKAENNDSTNTGSCDTASQQD